ncbi:MAG TPA: MFS transporter [Myxococcota bacterium]|nr:MFS transporter [Myxococcota bacterium]
MSSRFSLLREPNFARVFAARLISAFGTPMGPVALPFAVLEDLHGTARDVGLVIAAASAAQVTFLLLGGALADRGSRRGQMVIADLAAAGAQGTIAVLLALQLASVPSLILLELVIGTALALQHPAAVGLVPLVVEREALQPANALLAIAQSTAMGLGAAVAGLVAAQFGARVALAIDALTFLVSALLVSGVRERAQARGAPSESLWAELRDGWREFTSHRWLWTIVLQFTVMLVGWFGAYGVVGPVVAKRALGGAAAWGVIAAANGFGNIAGGLVILRVHFARPMLVATLCCFSFALLPLALIQPLPVPWIAAAAFSAGFTGEIFGVLWYTALHTHVDAAALSRVSAYDAVGSIALVPLGEVAAGFALDAYGPAVTLLAACAAIVVPTAAVLLVPEVRGLRAEAQVTSTQLAS